MLTTKRPPFENAPRQPVVLARQIKTKGGSKDTEQNALTVTPTGWPSSESPVTMVTPVAK